MTADTPKLSAAQPFPGLRPFEFEDHAYFFGREDQTYSLYRLLSYSHFVAVVGSSGSGKSSLVKAGLFPLLDRESQGDGGHTWCRIEMRPGGAPVARLTDAILAVSTDQDPLVAAARRDRVAAALRRSSYGLSDALREIDSIGDKTVILLVDQFEELFRFASGGLEAPGRDEDMLSDDEAAYFVQLLLEVTRDSSRKVFVMITMRSDFIGDCARFQSLPEAVSATQFLVPSLTRDQREEVVRKPVERADGMIESPLVERILNDSSDQLDQLPVLQHCMFRMWQAAGSRPAADGIRHLTGDDYKSIGGINEALSQHADEIFNRMPEWSVDIEQVFRALSERDRSGRATRRARPFNLLQKETGVPEDRLHKILDRFRDDDCSFLVPSCSAVATLAPDTLIDVGHEALLRGWGKVRGAAVASGVPDPANIGWLRVEANDGAQYRVLLSMTEGDDSETAIIQSNLVDERWKWWTSPPRTEAWARRYSPDATAADQGFERVKALFERSKLARSQEVDRRNAEERRRRNFLIAMVAASVTSIISALGIGLALKNTQHAETQTAQTYDYAVGLTSNLVIQLLAEYQSRNIPKEVISKILATVETTLNQLPNDSSDRIADYKLSLLQLIVDSCYDIGDTDCALKNAVRMKDLALDQNRNDPAGKWERAVFRAAFRVGDAKARQRKFDEALQENLVSQDYAKRFATREPDNATGQSDLVLAYRKVADTYRVLGDVDKSRTAYESALLIAQQLSSRRPEDVRARRNVALTQIDLGRLLVDASLEGASKYYDAALATELDVIRLEHGKNDASVSQLALAYLGAGDVKLRQDKIDEAMADFRLALATIAPLATRPDAKVDWKSQLAQVHSRIGDVLRKQKQPVGALKEYEQELAIRLALKTTDSANKVFQSSFQDRLSSYNAFCAEAKAADATVTCAFTN
jgi:tetratricopeptide (TPR) repeat protein